jgi:hypothetical protein
MPRGNQPARQWRLLQFLSSPPGLAVENAARELGCAVVSSWTHVGSGPTFGLGRYRIQPDGAGDERAA